MAKPKRRTEHEAVDFLRNRGVTIIDKLIKLDGCLGGLSGGSCLDYLVNYKGYTVARGQARKPLLRRIKEYFGR